jgi:hypothetical protein
MGSTAIAFDPSTATPEDSGGGFDPATAAPDASAPAQPGFAHDPHAGMTHAPQDSHGSLASMLYPEVDFDTGLPFLDRTHLAQADNFEEKKAYLEKVYGKKAVETDQDPYGKPMLVVNKDGKKIAAEGGGGFGSFAADVVGSGPEWSSMAAGAAQGAGIGALGGPADPVTIPLGGLIGAGIGGMFGKTAIEGEKAREGIYRKEPGQYAQAIGQAGESGMEGELGGKLTSSMVSKVLRGPLPQFLTQTTPESQAMTERTLAGGARPPAQSTVPGAKKVQFGEALARKTVSGVASQDEANTAYIEKRMRDILRDSGVPEAHIEPTLRELATDGSQVPTEEIGEHVKKRVQAHAEMLTGNVERQLQEANTEVGKQLKHLDGLTQRHNPGDLGVDVGTGIRQARRDFGTAMSKAYEKVDNLVGDRELVPTDLIRKEAQRIARLRPQTGQAPVTRELAGMGEPKPQEQGDVDLLREFGIEMPPSGKITFADAQRMRTLLREKADEANLTRGVTAGEMHKLAEAVDYSIQAAAQDPTAAPAVKLLNAADKAYGQGIKRFNDSTVKRLVKNLEAGLPPDPEEIARQIVQPGQEARVKGIRKLVGEQVWKRVAGADYARLIRDATNDTGEIEGTRLLAEVRARGNLMPVVYGDKLSQQIEELARSVAVRDGKLPPDALAPGRVRTTMEALRASQAAEDRFLHENYLGMLANPRRNPEAVYRWLVRPNNASALKEAVHLLGEGSPQLAGVRQAALKELMVNAKLGYADGRSATALSEALGKFTPEQQALLFPNGMDSDLHLLGKEIQFLMKNLSDESKASMAAGAILSLPFGTSIPPRVGLGLYQVLLSQPTVIRYLALGLRSPPGPARQAARGMLENLVRFGAISPTLHSNAGAPTNEQEGDTTLTGTLSSP